jgi:hypothetical protein
MVEASMETYNELKWQEGSESLLTTADDIIVKLQMLEMGARALQRAALNVPIRRRYDQRLATEGRSPAT